MHAELHLTSYAPLLVDSYAELRLNVYAELRFDQYIEVHNSLYAKLPVHSYMEMRFEFVRRLAWALSSGMQRVPWEGKLGRGLCQNPDFPDLGFLKSGFGATVFDFPDFLNSSPSPNPLGPFQWHTRGPWEGKLGWGTLPKS